MEGSHHRLGEGEVMSLCKYEISLLRDLRSGKKRNLEEGAAVFAACEVLVERGYVKNGKPTEQGLSLLSSENHSEDNWPEWAVAICDGCGDWLHEGDEYTSYDNSGSWECITCETERLKAGV